MDWWDVVFVTGVMGGAFGMAGTVFTLLRALPWGKNWNVGSYQ
jgi:hypothetical protein